MRANLKLFESNVNHLDQQNDSLKDSLQMAEYCIENKNGEIKRLNTKLNDEIERAKEYSESVQTSIDDTVHIKQQLQSVKDECERAKERYEEKQKDASRLNSEVGRLMKLLVENKKKAIMAAPNGNADEQLDKNKEDAYRKEIECLNTQLERQGARVSMELYKLAVKEAEELNLEMKERECEKEEIENKCRRLEREVMKFKGLKETTPTKKKPSSTPTKLVEQLPPHPVHAASSAAATPKPTIRTTVSRVDRTPLSANGGRAGLTARLKSVRSSGAKVRL